MLFNGKGHEKGSLYLEFPRGALVLPLVKAKFPQSHSLGQAKGKRGRLTRERLETWAMTDWFWSLLHCWVCHCGVMNWVMNWVILWEGLNQSLHCSQCRTTTTTMVSSHHGYHNHNGLKLSQLVAASFKTTSMAQTFSKRTSTQTMDTSTLVSSGGMV